MIYRIALFLVSVVPLLANSWTARGESAYSRAAYDTAAEYFQKAIEEGDSSGKPYFFLGAIYDIRKNYAQSASYYEQAVRRSLSSKYRKMALWKLVIYYDTIRRYPEALEHVNALEEIGVRHETLTAVRDRAQKSGSSSANPEVREKLNEAADAEKEYKDSPSETTAEKAAKAYHAAYRKDNEMTGAMAKAAFWYEKANEPALALKAYHSLYSREQNIRYAYKIGVLERKLRNYKTSLSYLALALEKPESKTMEYYLRLNAAQAHFAIGNYSSSRSHAEKALSLKQKKEAESTLEYLLCLNDRFLKTEKPAKCPVSEKGSALKESIELVNSFGKTPEILRAAVVRFLELPASVFAGTEWLFDGMFRALVLLRNDDKKILTYQEIVRYYQEFDGDETLFPVFAKMAFEDGLYLEAFNHCNRMESMNLRESAVCAKSAGYLQDYSAVSAILKKAAENYPEASGSLVQMLDANEAFAAWRGAEEYEFLKKEIQH